MSMRAASALIRLLLLLIGVPAVLVAVVPWWLARRFAVTLAAPADLGDWVLQAGGAMLIAVGAALVIAALRQIALRRQETQTPWDPPRRLVIAGPYRHVRNPLVSGVLFILFGEGLLLQSVPHLVWAAVVVLLALLYIPLLEEPQLEVRFGAEYQQYRRHVARLLPRLRPWDPEAGR
jgi:protein-S-isoprenylcysteine O-methyltransferase Ste14